MAMNRRVVIGFADALAAIESAWCLIDDGFDVYAFARRGTRPALVRSSAVSIIDITAPEEDAERSAADLSAALREMTTAAVVPLDDHAVWLCDRITREQLPGANLEIAPDGDVRPVVAGPVGGQASLALDKRQQLRCAEAAGFAVPASRDTTSGPPPGAGPWMVKPAMAVQLRSGRLVRPAGKVATSPAQVRSVAAAIGGPGIVQPLIDGTGEGVFGFAAQNDVVALSAHRRIRMMNPRGSGSSACQSIPVAEELIGPVSRFVAESAWRGMFMIELLRDHDGTPWFMELNGRAWGSMALACRRGFAYPTWAVRAALDARYVPETPIDAPDVTARHLGREIVHLGAVMARGGAPRLATVRDVLTVKRDVRWYNWRSSQAGVFAADTWATVRAQLRRGRSA
jgi:ATP-grasp in the biosynthetic pathway with Ter operon